jgi:hypothetical protein
MSIYFELLTIHWTSFSVPQTAMCRMLERVTKFKICWISRPTTVGHPILSVVLSHCEDPRDTQDVRCPAETGMDGLPNINVSTWPEFQNGVAQFDSFLGSDLFEPFAVAYSYSTRRSGTPCVGLRLGGFRALTGVEGKKFSLLHTSPHQT